jgi:hypothetical protein
MAIGMSGMSNVQLSMILAFGIFLLGSMVFVFVRSFEALKRSWLSGEFTL